MNLEPRIHPSRARVSAAASLLVGVLAAIGCEERAPIVAEGPNSATGGAGGTTSRSSPVRRYLPGERAAAHPGPQLPLHDAGGQAGSGGLAGDAGADAPPRPLGDTCPADLPGAKLVRVPAEGGGYFCMDQRETTAGEYLAFLQARKGDVSGQPPECAWNDRFAPELYDAFDPNYDEPTARKCALQTWSFLESHPSAPMSCVDFCDAFAYCAWAGKRLCGRVDRDGTKVYRTDEAPHTVSPELSSQQFEVYRVCTQGGRTKYPYGDEPSPGLCKDERWLAEHGLEALSVEPVSGECHGTEPPYDGIYDAAGGVYEWANLYFERAGTGAVLTTGTLYPATSAECRGGMGWVGITSVDSNSGIRCCADAVDGDGER